jgi:chorismate mutase
MSIAVLRAILGADTVDRLSENEIAALAHELDAEMRKDDVLSSRLSRVVLEAAHRIKADRDVEVAR